MESDMEKTWNSSFIELNRKNKVNFKLSLKEEVRDVKILHF